METKEKKGMTSFALKVIAIVTMFIDHCGAVFMERTLVNIQNSDPNYVSNPQFQHLLIIDQVMRSIGRIAFPIFIFLLVQGFMHTRSRLKYAIRLGLFALISEIPFNMAFKNNYLDASYQNVFFTLFLGFMFMCAADFIYKKHIAPWLGYVGIVISSVAVGFLCAVCINSMGSAYVGMQQLTGVSFIALVAALAAVTVVTEIIVCRRKSFEDLSKLALSLTALAVFMFGASLLSTDYNAGGVLAIAIAYVFRENNIKCFVATVITLAIFCGLGESIAIVGYFFIERYNGQKGKSMKYFFYAFYPCHLLAIALVAHYLLGL